MADIMLSIFISFPRFGISYRLSLSLSVGLPIVIRGRDLARGRGGCLVKSNKITSRLTYDVSSEIIISLPSFSDDIYICVQFAKPETVTAKDERHRGSVIKA